MTVIITVSSHQWLFSQNWDVEQKQYLREISVILRTEKAVGWTP